MHGIRYVLIAFLFIVAASIAAAFDELIHSVRSSHGAFGERAATILNGAHARF